MSRYIIKYINLEKSKRPTFILEPSKYETSWEGAGALLVPSLWWYHEVGEKAKRTKQGRKQHGNNLESGGKERILTAALTKRKKIILKALEPRVFSRRQEQCFPWSEKKRMKLLKWQSLSNRYPLNFWHCICLMHFCICSNTNGSNAFIIQLNSYIVLVWNCIILEPDSSKWWW